MRNGLLVLVGIVLLGLGSGSAYFQFKRPQLRAAHAERIASLPTTTEGRLAEWHRYGTSQIHHRLTKMARASAEQPWLVTYAVAADGGSGLPELWGVDVSLLGAPLSHIEEHVVVIDLPAPSRLGRLKLEGERARYVPLLAQEPNTEEAAQRLQELALWFLEGLPDALERDIPGARIDIRVRS